MAILTEAIGIAKDAIQIFKPKEPTPEEQKQKAGVWYRMLQDFVINQRTPNQLATAWRDQLPFAQKATKQRFMDNNIIGKSNDEIINTLVAKINDELIKGGFSSLSRNDILSGMGAGVDSVLPSNSSKISAGAGSSGSGLLDDIERVTDVNESRNYFYAGALLLVAVGVFAWSKIKTKKRRR